MQSNEKIIRDFAKDGMVKALALFYLIKQKYSNSVVYDYTPTKIAKLFNIHPTTAKKYVSYILKYRYLKCQRPIAEITHSGHLRLLKTKPIKRLCTLHIKPGSNLKDIEAILFEKILNEKTRRQVYRISEKRKDQLALTIGSGWVDCKRRRKVLSSVPHNAPEPGEISYQAEVLYPIVNIASDLGVSRGKAFSVINRLSAMGRIKYQKREEIIATHCPERLFYSQLDMIKSDHGYGYYYWYAGNVVKKKPNLMVFSHYNPYIGVSTLPKRPC